MRTSSLLHILDHPDQADALGWHTESEGDVIFGRVFAAPVLDNGGQVLNGPLTVSSVLSHEVLETLCDSHVNLWASNGNGESVALEVADPVESDSYEVNVSGTGPVTVSNFVTPTGSTPRPARTRSSTGSATSRSLPGEQGRLRRRHARGEDAAVLRRCLSRVAQAGQARRHLPVRPAHGRLTRARSYRILDALPHWAGCVFCTGGTMR
ncbi:hypothetical protein [Streptomyces sp. UNOB3_S3]|uniref:hypothetical protein n=1 Tax=Streptomyces sp. UNOB3_S3 TaxID=2871682 RepID=UPI001E40FEC6|nr:hypothetical protein [Streptomyces sp. UNOB3_S3]MCC3773273.1 hypothetical protein [Streptomyces sp. UNOB3_S3]